MAVHIPLYIGNPCPVQNRAHIFHNILPDFRFCKIQQQLMAAQHRCEIIRQRPVRMCPVQIRIRVDGFRFKPETEFHSLFPDPLRQAFQTVRQFFHIDRVISQPGLIAVSGTKPAVIQNEQLTTQFLCPVCQIQQSALAKVKHTAFPAVVLDGTEPVLPVFRDDMFIDKPVHIPGQTSEAAVAERQNRFRCFKAFAAVQLPAEITGIDSLHHPGKALQ